MKTPRTARLAAMLLVAILLAGPAVAHSEPAAAWPAAAATDKQSYLDAEVSHWDYFVAGFSVAPLTATSFQLLSYTWRHVRLTLIDAAVELGLGSGFPTVNWHLGSMVGLGAHTGQNEKSSHWLIFGLWYGEKHAAPSPNVNGGSYKGLYLPIGHEYRRHFGKNLRSVWGCKSYIAFSPVGKNTSYFRSFNQRFMFGFNIFVGL